MAKTIICQYFGKKNFPLPKNIPGRLPNKNIVPPTNAQILKIVEQTDDFEFHNIDNL